jgi:hypothetical protein
MILTYRIIHVVLTLLTLHRIKASEPKFLTYQYNTRWKISVKPLVIIYEITPSNHEISAPLRDFYDTSNNFTFT